MTRERKGRRAQGGQSREVREWGRLQRRKAAEEAGEGRHGSEDKPHEKGEGESEKEKRREG